MRATCQIAVIVFSFMGQLALAQEVHTIVLEVNSQSRTPLSTLTLGVDDLAQARANTTSESFVLNARVGDQIRWVGRSSDNVQGSIQITQIRYLKGPRIFSKELIQAHGAAQATVIRGGATPYYYEIHFSINGSAKDEIITSRIVIAE